MDLDHLVVLVIALMVKLVHRYGNQLSNGKALAGENDMMNAALIVVHIPPEKIPPHFVYSWRNQMPELGFECHGDDAGSEGIHGGHANERGRAHEIIDAGY